jgi:4-oxalocrotonate tautomerase
MSGVLPDVRIAVEVHDYLGQPSTFEEGRMTLIQVKVIAGVFTTSQKQEIIGRLTDALVHVQGEGLRSQTWCVIEEVPSGAWGIGGQVQVADDVRAIASA